MAVALTLLGVLVGPAFANVHQNPSYKVFEGVLSWPEEQRAFVQDGPQLLLDRYQYRELFDLDITGRDQWIENFLAQDPVPETPENELALGIERRRALALGSVPTFQDVRAHLLFLHGPPDRREIVDCAETFKPMELWTYWAGSPRERTLVLYQRALKQPWILWLPFDNKRAVYTDEMAYYLDQWEELKDRIRARKRIDEHFCQQQDEVDRATGVDGLFGFRENRPRAADFQSFLDPPTDMEGWARAAMAAPETEGEALEGGASLELLFPERKGQRMVTRFQIIVENPAELEVIEDGEARYVRLVADGHLERPDQIFEDFRVRFQVPVPEEGLSSPIALQAERALRPGQRFLLRMSLRDEASGRSLNFARGIRIASEPTPVDELEVPDEAIEAISEALSTERVAGYDSILLVPPSSDVLFGLWRAEALVTGTRIERVKYFIDGKQVFSRKGPPFTAELRLAEVPREQVVRVEGFDSQRELVGFDEVVINQPRGELRVRILEPKRGTQGSGAMKVSAEVVVPEEKRVEKLEVKVNDALRETLLHPPWETQVEIPADGAELTYITVAAQLDDGLRAEDVRFVNAPEYLEEVDVNLVELYTTVTDRGGQLVQGLEAEAFEVFEDGRPQKVAKFELVQNLPLSLGLAIDVSGSMFEKMGVAQRTAIDFLENIITPRDRVFALAFSNRPEILMPRTSDVGAIAERILGLAADGATSLHDAVVTSLYYYRGIRGRRALILLSDGEDTSSSLGFREALEYSRRSGVAIYAIGLGIGKSDFGVRNKLDALANQTGGRTFYIKQAEDLRSVYAQIEKELRSQYLVAYNSDSSKSKDEYREIELKVQDGKLNARTIRGYYP